jgi:hypothetical protein
MQSVFMLTMSTQIPLFMDDNKRTAIIEGNER